MHFTWDERKRQRNLEKHGIDFARVGEILFSPHVLIPSAYGGNEPRFLAVGKIEGRISTVVFTIRDEPPYGDKSYRIITQEGKSK